jgi:hypothetical protein
VWNPGDGSDTVEGQGGQDTLQFNGANVNEKIDLSANGSRLRLFRDVGNVTMDVNGVEQVNVAALGGADSLTLNDLSGTDVTDVNLDLSGTPGSGMGDSQADTVIVNAGAGLHRISVTGSAGQVDVHGLAARLHIAGAEPAIDRLIINAGAGDVVDASGLNATAIGLVVNGGMGNGAGGNPGNAGMPTPPNVGPIGLLIEEVQLTIDTIFSEVEALLGMSNASLDAMIAQLQTAIQTDVSFSTSLGQSAVSLGQSLVFNAISQS